MTKIYTNLNINNMADELRNHFRSITNKQYIENSITLHYKYKMINYADYQTLKKEYNI